MKALLLSGAGRYADAWHPFPETSAILASMLTGAGWQVEQNGDVEAAIAAIGDDVDLLVTNLGRPTDSDGQGLRDAAAGLARHAARGGAVFAVHASLNAFGAVPLWGELLGARWVEGISMHPPKSVARIHVDPDWASEALEVHDELYTHLVEEGARTVIASHRFGSVDEPLVWTREVGASRIVVDALGHDADSWDSAVHRAFWLRCLEWVSVGGKK